MAAAYLDRDDDSHGDNRANSDSSTDYLARGGADVARTLAARWGGCSGTAEDSESGEGGDTQRTVRGRLHLGGLTRLRDRLKEFQIFLHASTNPWGLGS